MSGEAKDDTLTYTPDEFALIIKMHLDGAGYPYCDVKIDEGREDFHFYVVEGLCTKRWGYEQFLTDYECDEHEPWDHDYQERILREMYGALGRVECAKGEIRVRFLRPVVHFRGYA